MIIEIIILFLMLIVGICALIYRVVTSKKDKEAKKQLLEVYINYERKLAQHRARKSFEQEFKAYVDELTQKIPKISREEFVKQVTIKFNIFCKNDEKKKEELQNILIDILKDVTIYNMQFPQ
jgi:predicted nucleotide-binding protein (sugar kinase/HSP70/actin superfamily)